MSTLTTPTPDLDLASGPVVVLKRRTIDTVLISLGVVAAAVLLVAGGLLTWGANFSDDYVQGELTSQNIFFPPAEALEAEGRTDLLSFAGQQVETAAHAEAYASFIDGHLGDQTYADLGTPEREARAAVTQAVEAGASDAEIAALQDEAAAITAERDRLFKGETLRGLLLTAFAWGTVGQIAGYAAIGAFIAAGLMIVLVALGIRHHHKDVVTEA
ncbi:MAG: hypothetical protein ACXIVQ_02405 [Acidimicrobiales bacterium]